MTSFRPSFVRAQRAPSLSGPSPRGASSPAPDLHARLSLPALLLLTFAALSSAACGSVVVEPGSTSVDGDDPPPVLPPADVRSGLTWSLLERNEALGVDLVGCGDTCNAYEGDTACSDARPVLCVRYEGAPNPGVAEDFYHGWIGGPIALTPPLSGLALGSRAEADAFCAQQLGPGFVMAEFHHPSGGWNWWGFGAIAGDSRFWVAIDDQPANCWD